jgi:hypothetical protein
LEPVLDLIGEPKAALRSQPLRLGNLERILKSNVIYQSEDGKDERVFDALEWLAAMLAGRSEAKTGVLTSRTRESKW